MSERLLSFRKSSTDPLSLTVNDVLLFLRENDQPVLANKLSERANEAEKKMDEARDSGAYYSIWMKDETVVEDIRKKLKVKWWKRFIP